MSLATREMATVLFLPKSLNSRSSMKTNLLTAYVSKRSRIFSWHNVANLLNAMPLGICECKTAEDAKGYVKALSLLISGFILAAIEKGGSL